jgi:hypothetical protein
VTQIGQNLLEVGRIVDSISIGRTRTGDRFDDHRVADVFRSCADLVGRSRPGVPGSPDTPRIETLFHRLLVAKQIASFDAHTWQLEGLA